MVIYSFGGPSIDMQVGQLVRLSAHLENLVENPKIKKLVLEATSQSIMLKRPYNIPWDAKHGV